MKMTLLK